MIRVTIPLVPVGQRRARSTVLNGHARTYKAREQVREEHAMLYCLADAKPNSPLEGPLVLSVVAFLPVPSSWARKRRSGAIAGEILPTVKPDLDNMAKHILDCMQQLRFFGDDKQVCRMVLEKRYGTDPKWVVELGEIQDARAHAQG